ncbi:MULTISPECIES: GreA/GreB family elongation factor [Achromobacter]|uniref:Regulator of nucleoside diphosphate kinase n=2 Tax=Achromobacter piechaudii TaxID=72556 RepID=A0A6S7E639_9BURK|nr:MULTISPECIES: GreA/GreB family elongation factor [Achromobacter]EFF73839.1 putative nucleoside diphosphate kinase regulator [Achromobacter piechaudii ATCC 43553]KNY06613.1 transcription elongation factor [Achromobacter piechaudii]MPS81340.1 transcription elongation factor [Achromobacter sp.]CAB3739542.1 Regulator of nucleoside diphosphate kinase [Achromobacter piechaudii]CAB3895661.1 Regulator of nucleoside diphosphate kinase [Achromobacter piechaudii]
MNAVPQDKLITALDHARLLGMITRPASAATLSRDAIDAAQELLDSAPIIPIEEVTPDIITMRSRVRLLNDKGDEMVVTLCYPADANLAQGQVSVMSPLGLSLIGSRTGQLVTWTAPNQTEHSASIEEILYQPEAAGDTTA